MAPSRPLPAPRGPLPGVLLTLALLLLAAWLLRVPIAAWAGSWYLTRVTGLPASLQVSALGLDRLTVGALRLGGDALDLHGAEVTFTPAGLFAGRVTGLAIDRLEVRPAAFRRPAAPAGAGSGGWSLPPLPALRIARLTLHLGAGGDDARRLDGSVALHPEAGGGFAATGTLALPAHGDAAAPAAPALDWSLAGTPVGERVAARARLHAIDLPLAALAAFGLAPGTADGALTAAIEGEASLAPGADWTRWLAAGTGTLHAQIALRDGAWPGIAAAAGAATGTATLGAGRLALSLDGRLDAALAPAALAALAPPDGKGGAGALAVTLRALHGEVALGDNGRSLAGPVGLEARVALGDGTVLDLAGTGTARAALAADGMPQGVAADAVIEATLAASRPPLTVAGARLRLPLTLSAAAEGWTVTLSRPADLALRRIAVGAVAAGPLAATVGALAARPLAASGADGAVFAARVTAAPLAIALDRGDAPPWSGTLDPGRLDIDWAGTSGTLDLAGAGLVLPAAGLDIAGAAARVRIGADGALAFPFALAEVRVAPLAPPLRVEGRVARSGPVVRASAAATALDGRLRLTAEARHDSLRGVGTGRATLAPLRFGAGGVALAELIDGLEATTPEAGTLSGATALAWTGERLDGTLDLAADGLSLGVAGLAVEDLNGRLALAALRPPATAAPQSLRAGRLDLGVALTDIDVTYAVAPTATGARLLVPAATAGLLGGRLRAEGGEIDPARGAGTADLVLEGIDLDALARLLAIEGVAGEGRVSGRLPVRFADRRIAVAGGRVAGDGPGVLRLRSAAVKDALAAGGEPVDLLLQALEDFRYDRLEMTVEKALAGAARTSLSLAGHNPAVLNGHPFVLNVSLSGDADRLAAALGAALDAAQQTLGGALRRGR